MDSERKKVVCSLFHQSGTGQWLMIDFEGLMMKFYIKVALYKNDGLLLLVVVYI